MQAITTDERAARQLAQDQDIDAEEAVELLLRDLRTSREGLSSAEAQRRAQQYGRNELKRHEGVNWPKEVWSQLTQPLALLLWVAAGLEFAISSSTIGTAIVLVILINAVMALADSLGAICAFLNLPEGSAGTTTVESKTNFMRAVRDGFIEAVSRPLHTGRTVIVVETDVRDASDRLVARATQTQLVLPRSSA